MIPETLPTALPKTIIATNILETIEFIAVIEVRNGNQIRISDFCETFWDKTSHAKDSVSSCEDHRS